MITDAKKLGYCLKLLAIGKQTEAGIEVRVHPTLVRKEHPLASVNDSFNAVYITGDAVGEVMLYGRGAGSLPTGSAIVSDVIYASTHSENRYSTFKNTEEADGDVKFPSDFTCAYCLRIRVPDRTGVLSKLTSVFAKNNISIVEVLQSAKEGETAAITLITHETRELAVRNAVEKIDAMELAHVESVLRVVS